MDRCISGKRMYPTRMVAEDVLIETRTKFEYNQHEGPVAVYQCDECGQYHLTSKGPMNERLAKALEYGAIRRQKEADRWLNKLKKKR